MGAGKKIACIIIFAILISIPSIILYILVPNMIGSGATPDMIITGLIGAALGVLVGVMLAFGGGRAFLGAFLGGLVALLIALLGLMFFDTLSGFTGGLLVGLSTFIQQIAGSFAILVNFIFAPILLNTPIDWILINRSPLIDPTYTMYVLFGILPFILGGIVAGLLCKGYRKGVMAGGLVGVNLMVGMVLMMGVLVLFGNLAGLYFGTPIDVVSMFSGLYEGMFGRNMWLYILSGFEAAGISAAFGSLIGALRGPPDED